MVQEISHLGYCALGGAANPRLFSRPIYLGKTYMFTCYYFITTED